MIRTRLKPLRSDLLIVAAFLILPMILFWDVTVGGRTMIPADNLFQWQPWATYAQQYDAVTPHNNLLSDLVLENYPWKTFAIESLQNGEIPLWNPHIFAGQPFLANGQHGMYYPFNWLFFLLPILSAFGWFTVSQLWLAGVSGYIFGRTLRLGRPASALLGLVYQGSGFMLVSAAVFPMIISSAVWLPFLLACIENVIRRSADTSAGNTLPWAIAGAVGVGMNILAGHPEITLYTLLIMALYAAWKIVATYKSNIQKWIKPGVWLSIMVGVGLLLGAVQLIPSIELASTNFRDGSASFEEVQGWAFPKRRILTLALPNFFGNPSHHDYTDIVTGETVPFTTNAYGEPNPHGAGTSNWGIKNYVEGGIYLGILPLILSAVAVGRHILTRFKKRDDDAPTLFFTLLGFLSLNFIFGTPLYALLFYGLPFIDQLHSPFRWVFALSLSVAVLAAVGLEWFVSINDESRRLALFQFATFPIPFFAILWFSGRRFIYQTFQPQIDNVFAGLAQAPDAFADGGAFFSYLHPQIYFFIWMIFMSILAIHGVVSHAKKTDRILSKFNWFWLSLPLIFTAADFWAANRHFHAATDPALLDVKPELVHWLEAQPGDWRITSFAPKDTAFHANSGWLYNIEDVRGYDSIINRQYTDYMGAIEEQSELQFNRIAPIKQWQSLNSPLLDLLTVKYIITSETLNLPKLSEVWAAEGVRVYENLAVMPRAYTIPASATVLSENVYAAMQSAGPRTVAHFSDLQAYNIPFDGRPQTTSLAAITTYGNVEVTIQTTVDRPSWLILNDSHAQGWRAFVRPAAGDENDEIEQPVELVNGNFRAVMLNAPGDHIVRFRYSPRSFIIGGLASVMAGIVIVFGFVVWLWRRFYRQEGELTNTQSIAKNSMAPMALNLFNKLIDFAFAMFYLRVLGTDNNGAYAQAIGLALWFDIVANWGLDALIVREVAQDRSQAGRYLFNTTLLRLGLIVIVLPIIMFGSWQFWTGKPMQSEMLMALLFIGIGMIFSGIGKGITGLFYVWEAAEYPAVLSTITTILKVVFGVVVLLIGYGFVGLAAVSIITNVITLALLIIIANRHFDMRTGWQFDPTIQRNALRMGWPLMLNHLLATVFFKIDQVLLGRIDSDSAAGIYNSAYKWVDALNVIPSFFTFALFPIISRQVTSNIDDARRTYRMAVKLLVLVALPVAAVVTLLATPMIGTLGGDEFLPDGATALRLVIWSIPIGWINSVTNYTIISLGLERRLTIGFVVGVLFNTLGNIALIPRFGYQAAAVTTILSELVLLIMFNYYLRQRMPAVDWGKLLVRPILVAIGMVAAMLALSQINLILALIVGIIIYPVGLFALRIFGDEERQILAQIVPASLATRLKLI